MLERFEKFTFMIYEIQRCWNKIAAEGMEFCGLKGSYAIYLTAMHRHPEGITAAQLCTLCGRDKADVSRAVAVLESKGLLTKESGSGNLYRAKLLLTEQGIELTKNILQKAETAENIAGRGLSDGDREVLYRALGIVCENMQDLAKSGIPAKDEETVPYGQEIITLY